MYSWTVRKLHDKNNVLTGLKVELRPGVDELSNSVWLAHATVRLFELFYFTAHLIYVSMD